MVGVAAYEYLESSRTRVPCLGFLGEVQEKESVGVIGVSEFLMMLGAIGPALALWIAVIIFAAIMLRKDGGRAERLLIAGASLKIASNLIGVFPPFIIPWLIKGYSHDVVLVTFYYEAFFNIVGMAGIICLVYSFWVKFKSGQTVNNASLE